MTQRSRRDAPRGKAVSDTAFTRIKALLGDFSADFGARIDGLQEQVQHSENKNELVAKALSDTLTREVAHLNQRLERFHESSQREIANLREELRDHERLTAEGVARGAASGAAEAAASLAVKPKGFFQGWKGWAVTVGAIVAGLAAFADGVPKVITWLERFWAFLKGGG